MKKRTTATAASFLLAFGIHVLLSAWKTSSRSSQWVGGPSANSALAAYFARHDYFLGLSYALSAAFTVYALFTFLRDRKGGTGGMLGGMTLTGVLYFGGCFLAGCCGSPLLPVYLGLFGSSALGFTKPVVFAVTTVSVGLGMWLLRRRAAPACNGPGRECGR